MTALVGSIFIASLLGSLHCVGMCGAFLAIATGESGRPARTQAAYHLGRLATYLALGAIAGTAGAVLDLGASLAGLTPIAAILAGATMVLAGLAIILNRLGVKIPTPKPPAFMQRIVSSKLQRVLAFPPTMRAATIGLLTTLLPCGWLWAFVISAAGTAHPLNAVAVMFVFWLGTLPALISLGAGVRAAMGALGRHAGVVVATLVIAAGVFTIVRRGALDLTSNNFAHASHEPESTPPCCADHAN